MQNTDGAFEQFESMAYGVRALMKLLTRYIHDGHNTVRLIIERYAPASENDTKAYIKAVCGWLGVGQNEPLFADEYTIKKLATGICHHENGGDYVDIATIDEAWKLTKEA